MAGKRRGLKVDGWVILDKPVGMTSTQAVGAVRRVFQAAKAGHGGTLDPLATGLLPIALGEATKTVPYVMDGMKTYRFTLRFGEARATDDAEGEVIATSDLPAGRRGNPGRTPGLLRPDPAAPADLFRPQGGRPARL